MNLLRELECLLHLLSQLVQLLHSLHVFLVLLGVLFVYAGLAVFEDYHFLDDLILLFR